MIHRFVHRAVSQKLGLTVSAFLALAIVSCPGCAVSPTRAVKKMVHAHGGHEKVARLQCFVGRGFIKNLAETNMAESFAFDVYRKGQLYKHTITDARRGKIANRIVMYYDGRTSYQWVYGKGLREIPPRELGMLEYRFPQVLQWAESPDHKGEVLPVAKNEGVIRLRYHDGSNILTLTIDRKSWLLSGVEVKSSADSSFVYSEAYGHYFDLDGIPFPLEFKAGNKGMRYYEFILPAVELKADIPDSLLRVTREDTVVFSKPPAVEKPAAVKKPAGAK